MAVETTTTTTATTAAASAASVPEQQERDTRDAQESVPSLPRCKSRLFSWRVAGALLAFLVVLGWIFIIVMLILEEKWQLVLVAWLLLYSAAHFCYWYCKRHSLITLHRQIRLRVLTHSRNPENGEKSEDVPPTYDEVMKTEAPPPAYFTVVTDNFKPSSGFSPCVPAGMPSSVSYCNEKQPQEDSKETQNKKKKKKNDKRNMLSLEIRECPPAYQSPKSPRALSPRIPMDSAGSLVTATAAATAAATATAAFSYLPAAAIEEVETLEDPIRNPIVQHLRSAEMPTLEVSSNVDVSSGSGLEEVVTSDVLNQMEVVDVHRSSIL